MEDDGRIINILTDKQLSDIVTEDLKVFNKFATQHDDFKILINPFNDRKNLQPASYDICVGDEYTNITTGEKFSVGEKGIGTIEIKPKECVRIKAYETIGIPYNVTAIITTKNSLAKHGIMQITSRIDSTYVGSIEITFFNAGKDIIPLNYKEEFANLVFFKNGTPVEREYEKGGTGKRCVKFSPVTEKIVSDDEEGSIELIKYSGSPFDRIGWLLKIQKKDYDAKIKVLTDKFEGERRIYKALCGFLVVILAGIIASFFIK